MGAKNENVCPYCGESGFMRVEHVDAHNCFITCTNCAAGGPVHFGGSDSAIDAFCHPAHLLADLHTYNPATHVVVSREAARRIADTWFVDSPFSSTNDDAALAELRAALEGEGR